MNPNNTPTILDQVSSELPRDFDQRLIQAFTDQMDHDRFRKKVREIILESIGTVEFMKKIKEYSAEEIDNKIFKSMGFYFKTIIIPIGVAVLTVVILHYIHLA